MTQFMIERGVCVFWDGEGGGGGGLGGGYPRLLCSQPDLVVWTAIPQLKLNRAKIN